MSSSKKSTVTLHNFFSSGPSSLAKEKGKTRNSIKSAKKTVSPDIIVIDSDSDVEHRTTQAKVPQRKRKRRLSESSGEVEFVNPSPVKYHIQDGQHKNRDGKDIPRKPPIETPPSILNRPNGTTSSDPLSPLNAKLVLPRENKVPSTSFGAPLLLNNTTVANSHTPPSTISFGKPVLLLGRSHAQLQPSLTSESSSTVEETKLHPELPDVNDDWRMGDDEVVFCENDDSFQETSINQCDTSLTELETLAECPFCNKSLRGWLPSELQVHINYCLDSAETSSTSTRPTDVPTVPTPLSSFAPGQTDGPLQLVSCDGKTKPSVIDAFSLLMSSHKENEVWKEASAIEDQNSRPTKGTSGRRRTPFYKVLDGMPIAVDAFCYGTIPGVTAYFLTHAHSDHYTNLASNWKSGPIYCSEGTANLIIHMLSVDRKWVHPLPMDVPTVVPNTGGVSVTLIEANHCPGSCLFYFEGPQTVHAGDSAFPSPFIGSSTIFRYLHCGDFRASPRHVLHPAIKGLKMDNVYLDTTYLDPKYTFPPQSLVVSACAELVQKISSGQTMEQSSVVSWMTTTGSVAERPKESQRVLFVVGTYSVGKERIVKAIAQALKTRIYCDPRKAAILRCQADSELNELLTADPLDASVHIVPLGFITSDKLKMYVERFKGRFIKVVGFRPTGWTYTQTTNTGRSPSVVSILTRSQQRDINLRPSRNSTVNLQLYPIPYSEHSSFYELTCFAMSFDWGKIIPTVNVGSETSRDKMAKWITMWGAERKRRGKVEVVPCQNLDYW